MRVTAYTQKTKTASYWYYGAVLCLPLRKLYLSPKPTPTYSEINSIHKKMKKI